MGPWIQHRPPSIGKVLLALVLAPMGCGHGPVSSPSEATGKTERTQESSPAPQLRPAESRSRPSPPTAAIEWLRFKAPSRYASRNDAELLALSSIELHDAPPLDILRMLAHFPDLTHLKIWDTGERFGSGHSAHSIDDDSLAILGSLTALQTLEIGGWNMKYTDEGLRHLGALESLRRLSLCQAQGVTDDGLRHLQTLSQLAELDLTYTKITDVGLEHLLRIRSLRTVRYGWAAETERWRQRFLANHPEQGFLE